MAARILPFKRPGPKETPTTPPIPPPMITGHGENWCSLIGTKEQLLAWGACEERHFPVGRKRVAWNGKDEPHVRAVKSGLFAVGRHAGRDEQDERDAIVALTIRIQHASSDECRATTGLFTLIDAWRSRLIFSRCDGYEAGLLEPLDAALYAFRRAAVAMVTYRKPPEVGRLPPDETEPEHAQ